MGEKSPAGDLAKYAVTAGLSDHAVFPPSAVLHPELDDLHTTYTNDWSYGIGPGSYLLDVVPIIMGHDKLKHTQKMGALQKVVKKIFSGNVMIAC